MNTKSIYLVSAVSALTFTLSLPAADQTPNSAERTDNNYHNNKQQLHRRDGMHDQEPLGTIDKASDVIGMNLRNQQDEKLGEVQDFGVDLRSGRIVYVVISTGGLLGIGSESVAVPPQALKCDRENKIIHLDTTKERLKAAPKFDASNWETSSQSNRVAAIYGYYDQHPYFQQSETPKHSMHSSTTLGMVRSAKKIMGMDVRNKQDEKLGTVDNLMVNLEAGRIAQVVISSGGFLGIDDELNAMPPSAFSYSSDGKYLMVDATKESLTAAPHFKNKEWPDFSDPQYSGSVYKSYHASPYFNTSVEADNTGRNVADRDGNKLTPLDQGTSSMDVQTTRNIRKELMDEKSLSVTAQNIKVITKDGEVTLRGPVASEEEKLQIGKIAARYAVSSQINNELEVKGQ